MPPNTKIYKNKKEKIFFLLIVYNNTVLNRNITSLGLFPVIGRPVR
jgi:hypothetical protein